MEFNPASEKHFGLLFVKAVEPGCTTELQIENLQTGEVTRLTTADDPIADDIIFDKTVGRVFRLAWKQYCSKPTDVWTCTFCGRKAPVTAIICSYCGAEWLK